MHEWQKPLTGLGRRRADLDAYVTAVRTGKPPCGNIRGTLYISFYIYGIYSYIQVQRSVRVTMVGGSTYLLPQCVWVGGWIV